MTEWQKPTDIVFTLMGGASGVARICGLHRTAPYSWLKQSARGGGGYVPAGAAQRALLDHAEAHGIPLTAEHLIRGCSAAELKALQDAVQSRVAAE
ncbi:MAG: hypothetical protein AAF192_08710 [Pseudomonadota bacterium]